MSDHEHTRTAPLVAYTAEEAAETMISEGGPLGQPHGPSSGFGLGAPWDEMLEDFDKKFHETVVQHPLASLLAAVGLGMFVGGLIRRD